MQPTEKNLQEDNVIAGQFEEVLKTIDRSEKEYVHKNG